MCFFLAWIFPLSFLFFVFLPKQDINIQLKCNVQKCTFSRIIQKSVLFPLAHLGAREPGAPKTPKGNLFALKQMPSVSDTVCSVSMSVETGT